MGHLVSTNDVLIHEFLNLGRRDGCECFNFNPFGEVVNSYYNVLNATSPIGKFAN